MNGNHNFGFCLLRAIFAGETLGMKSTHYFILFLYLFIQSCSGGSNSSPTGNTMSGEYAADTSEINKLLNRASAIGTTNPDSALKYLNVAEAMCLKSEYDEGYAKALFQLGSLIYAENNYQQALDYYSQALELAKNLNLILLKAKCLERMASVNLTLGNDHFALKLYYEALPLFEQTKNKEGIAKVYNIIGLYKSGQNEYDSAENYYQNAMKINEEIGNKRGVVNNKGNLGYLYEITGKLNQATNIYNELIDFLVKAGDSLDLPVIYYNFSSLYEKKDQADTALLYLGKALAICEKTRDTALMSTLYGNMGEIFLAHSLYDSARLHLNKSIACSKATGDIETQAQATKLLLELDTLKGDYRKAVARINRLLALNDSVFSRKTRHDLKTSELQFKNEKQKNFINVQTFQIQTSKKQNQLYLMLLLLSAVTVFLLTFLIMLTIRSNKRKQTLLQDDLKIKDLQIENAIKTEEVNKLRIEKIEEEIKIKEREQMSNALAIEQKNELLGLINNKITETMRDTGIITIKDLNGIVSSIRSNISDSTETDLFNQKFNQLHNNFFDYLKKSHPALTNSELKFCAYLKLKLSGNQIASIMNVTTEAIRKNRYRIRKKLKLEKDASLEDYISKF